MKTTKPQVVIPMSGIGKRFVDAGFYHLKPLIPIGNSRIINEVMSMFPGIDDPLFIVSKDHKQKNELINYLKKNWPKCQISEISEHKFGPGHAIFEAKEYIDSNRPVIVSYCDFSGNWDFVEFCNQLTGVDSLILTYTGFHPHMLRNTKYAYVRKDSLGNVVEIQEKNSFTDFPSAEEASAGLYAFSSGRLLIEALSEQVAMNYSHMGEYYISLTIVPLLKKNLVVKTFLMEKFSQFGTPEDLNDWEYLYKAIKTNPSNEVKSEKANARRNESAVILAGGVGSRLSDFSETPKPFIKFRDIPLWKISKFAACNAKHSYMLLRKEFSKYLEKTDLDETELVILEKPTQGQAHTAKFALDNIDNLPGPVTFFSCDNLIRTEDYENAIEKLKFADLVVWTSSDYPMAKYKSNRYSWVDSHKNAVTKFALKNLPKGFKNPSMIIGNFTFKNRYLAQEMINKSFELSERYNSEIYLDSVVQIALEFGYDVTFINSDKFYAIGTEDELKTYHYYSSLKMSDNFQY